MVTNGPLLSAAMASGFITLDIIAWGPWMVSQPLVCGPLLGWWLGHVKAGVIVGGIAQLIWMDITPVGVGIPYDVTAVTLLGVYWGSLDPGDRISYLVLALVLAVPFGVLFRVMDQYARRLNTIFARWIESVPDPYLTQALTLGIFGGTLWSWVRYALFFSVAMKVGERLLGFVRFPPDLAWVERGFSMAGILLPIAGMGVVLELFLSEEPERRFVALRAPKTRKGISPS